MIGRDWRTSTPWWPPDPEPPAGAPNVLMIVLDDVGFAQLGCYGSDIATPTLDGLADNGVRLTNFHTTALCSPTRSCLLTGRNHHRNGMGRVADLAVGYPGYCGRIPRENGFLSEIAARQRVRHLRGRQVAPHARRRDAHGVVAGVVAARPRLRPLVRVPRRRDASVRAVALPRQPFGAAARATRGRLPPERRPRRSRDRLHRRPPRRRRRSPVLLLLRDRRVPLAAPRAAGMDRAVPRPVRRRLGRVARRDVRPPDRRGRPARAHAAVAPAALGARVGLAQGRRPRGRRALHGVLRRVPVVHRRADRRGCSRSSSAPATSTTR